MLLVNQWCLYTSGHRLNEAIERWTNPSGSGWKPSHPTKGLNTTIVKVKPCLKVLPNSVHHLHEKKAATASTFQCTEMMWCAARPAGDGWYIFHLRSRRIGFCFKRRFVHIGKRRVATTIRLASVSSAIFGNRTWDNSKPVSSRAHCESFFMERSDHAVICAGD